MSSIILEARDVRYRYPRGMEAICGISFHIRRKEKIALVGPNGAGKSTLLTMFNGMIRRIPVSSFLTTSQSGMMHLHSEHCANGLVLCSRIPTGRLLLPRSTRM